jgi:hypothetical protein
MKVPGLGLGLVKYVTDWLKSLWLVICLSTTRQLVSVVALLTMMVVRSVQH